MVKPLLTSSVPMRKVRGLTYLLLPLLPTAEALDSVMQRRRIAEVAALEGEAVRLARVAVHKADVTVVIPTYKRPDLLRLAVNSVARQDFRGHVRALVVDDAGGQVPDDVRALDLVDVVDLGTNIGVAGAVRNVGLKLSESPYVALLDDDNEWEPEHLSCSLNALRRCPEASASTTLHFVLDDNGRVQHLGGGAYDARRLRHGNYIDTSTIVLRRHPDLLFSRLPRRRGSYRIEDWALLRAARRRGPIVHVPLATVRYRRHSDSYFSVHGRHKPTSG